jgi:predicted DNA-binding transcriptional regulator YafY
MTNKFSEELLRQIEMASLILEKQRYYSEDELAEKLDTSVTTIRRDANKLRQLGVGVYSRKNVFEIINIDDEVLNTLITAYLSLNDNINIRNLKLIHKKFGENALSVFVKILKAINGKQIIELGYGRNMHGDIKWREITPISLINTGRTFHLYGVENDDSEEIKCYLIERIINIRFGDKKSSIKKLPGAFNIYEKSWGTFSGGEAFDVELKFTEKTGKLIKDKIWIENQEIIEKDDAVFMKMKVKLSYEFIAWVMGWGKEVEVIKPAELKKEITQRAEDIISLYK